MDNVLRELVRVFGLLERVMQPYFAGFGISGSQWSVLRHLHGAELEGCSGLRMSDLSERLLIRPPSVTSLIDGLERSGLVQRMAPLADLRVRQIQLTPGGRQLVLRILAVHDQQVSKVLGGLSASKQATLRRLLADLSGHLRGLLDQDKDSPATVGTETPSGVQSAPLTGETLSG